MQTLDLQQVKRDLPDIFASIATQTYENSIDSKELRYYVYAEDYRVIYRNWFSKKFDERFTSLEQAVEAYNTLGSS